MNIRQAWLPLAVGSILACLPAEAATYYVSPSGSDRANGTKAAPWRSLQQGVDQLKPGDILLIASGTYRERVEVKRGGTAKAPVTISAMPGARVVVTGADLLPDGWTRHDDGAYSHAWPHRFPINGPDDLTHPADKEHELTGRAEQVTHLGRPLRQVLRRDQVAPGTFFVDLAANKLYVKLRDGGDPANTDIEASTRGQWLSSGASHVRARGVTFRHAANHAQRGAFVLVGKASGWVVEDCVFERANGPGATFTGEGHVVRRSEFRDNGQLGFGAWSCHDTRIEECGVSRNNVKGYLTDWEAGGLKVTMSRGFVLDRCRVIDNRGPGIWYDIGNEKATVSHCLVADNDEAGVFYEISYGLHAHDNVVVNNANAGTKPRRAWGYGGITLSSSEDCVIEHNTVVGNRDGITFREQNRTTPRLSGGEVRILNRGHAVRNNVVAHSEGHNVALWFDTTFFGPHPRGHDRNDRVSEDPKTLKLSFENNLLHTPEGRPNYLYGCSWRPRSKTAATPEEFAKLSGIADSSRVSDPLFTDILARDFRLARESPAGRMQAGVRDLARVPLR